MNYEIRLNHEGIYNLKIIINIFSIFKNDKYVFLLNVVTSIINILF